MSALKRLTFAVALAVGAAGLVAFGATVISEPGLRDWGIASFFMAGLIVILAASEDGDPAPTQEAR